MNVNYKKQLTVMETKEVLYTNCPNATFSLSIDKANPLVVQQDNEYKILAGTIYPANDNTAIGIISATCVFPDDATTSIVVPLTIFGFVKDVSVLPAQPTKEALQAMQGIYLPPCAFPYVRATISTISNFYPSLYFILKDKNVVLNKAIATFNDLINMGFTIGDLVYSYNLKNSFPIRQLTASTLYINVGNDYWTFGTLNAALSLNSKPIRTFTITYNNDIVWIFKNEEVNPALLYSTVGNNIVIVLYLFGYVSEASALTNSNGDTLYSDGKDFYLNGTKDTNKTLFVMVQN